MPTVHPGNSFIRQHSASLSDCARLPNESLQRTSDLWIALAIGERSY